ncbi:hypothetical protein ABFV74_06205 [Pseudoalteromonas distincta]|uniref:hypothetical protein n=1 Tax=Pseudoalteromonas distincta TaxID=77608 RepID=UPI003218B857
MDVINSLEALNKFVVDRVEAEGSLFSQLYKAVLSRDEVINAPLKDMTSQAEDWIKDACPAHLHLNHGEYVIGGMEHIINEIKNKPNSNRALYSLISTNKIINSQDDPIPSFLTFQCQIQSNILHCSVTFRALEASNFMRLNLEEIRIRIMNVIENFPNIETIELAIYSFHTYINKQQSMLNKPEIDTLSVSGISNILQNEPDKLKRLIDEKLTPTTVVDINCFEKLEEIFKENPPERLEMMTVEILENLKHVISSGEQYREARKKTSNSLNIEHRAEEYTGYIKGLRKIL